MIYILRQDLKEDSEVQYHVEVHSNSPEKWKTRSKFVDI